MENRRTVYLRLLVELLAAAAAVGCFALFGGRLLGILMPFLLALIMAWAFNPVIQVLQKHLRLTRKLFSYLLVLIFYALFFLLCFAFAEQVVTQVIGLAKREEEIFLEGQKESILLDKASPALHVIQHIRDEAHRFAITYHRKRLRRHNLVSILDQIEGIGPKRRQALWKAFPTLEGMRAASEEELAAVDGMTAPLARKLYEFFRGDVVQKTDLLGGRG